MAPPQNYALQYFVEYYLYFIYSAFDYPFRGQKIYDEAMKYCYSENFAEGLSIATTTSQSVVCIGAEPVEWDSWIDH